MRDALDQTGCGLDVEAPGGADGHAAKIPTRLLPARNKSPDQIPRLEPKGAFVSGQISAGETVAGEARTLVTPPTCGLDG